MTRIGSSDPRWKTASTGKVAALDSALKKKLLARMAEVIKWAPYRGTGQKQEVAKAFNEFMQDVHNLGYQMNVRSTSSHGPAWDLIELPLLSAMETGIEEHLGKFLDDAFKKARFVETESVFRMFAQDVAEEMLNYVQNHSSGTSAKPVISVDDDDVQVRLKVDEATLTDNQYAEIERVLDGLAQTFARTHDVKVQSNGIDYYNGDLTYTVRFSED